MLLPFASSIADADARLAPMVTPALLRGLTAAIPDDWLQPETGLPDPDAHRRAYVDYLVARLAAPRAFVEEADRARRRVSRSSTRSSGSCRASSAARRSTPGSS